MSNELNLEFKLCLHRIDVPFDALFTFGLGAKTEALHVSAVFINDQWQVLFSFIDSNAIGSQVSMCRSPDRIAVALVRIAWERSLYHFSFLTPVAYA